MDPRSYLRILLVEDHPGDARLIRVALAEAGGFWVEHLERLEPALVRLCSEAYDAVLLDLSLPESTGLETLRRVLEVAPETPVVVLSGLADEDTALEAVRRGAQDYLVKGQGEGVWVGRAVRYAVERKRAELALRRAQEELERRVRERTAHLEAANRELQREVVRRRRTVEALRRAHGFNRILLDTLGAFIVVLDPRGRLLQANRAGRELLGLDEEGMRGQPFGTLLEGPGEAETLRALLEQLHQGAGPQHQETHLRDAGGRLRLLAWTFTALRRAGGLESVVGVGVDVTERRRREEEERRRLSEAAHVFRLCAVGEMATQVAHELNQPLAAVANFAEAGLRLLQRGESGEVAEALRAIAAEARRAGEIIRRIRRFVRKAEHQHEPLALDALVQEALALVRAEARWRRATLEPELERGLLVQGDRVLLEQVVLNLVRNALEAVEGRAQGRVRVAVRRTEGWQAEVSVEDNGPGLGGRDVERLFEAFYTTKAEGVGLGLAISRSIVEAHGGRLEAASAPGGGARFTFRLPLCAGEASCASGMA